MIVLGRIIVLIAEKAFLMEGNLMMIQSLKLVYFSPTGTTKRIIERIARGINHSPAEVIDITKPAGRKQQLKTSANELLIIGVPVYSGRVPSNAIEWLHTIEAHNTPAVCAVVYGNREYEDALIELKDSTVKNGGIPIACAAFIGEHSFSNSETPIAVGRPDADDLNNAEFFGKKIKEKLFSVSSASDIADLTVPGNHPYKERIIIPPVDFIAVDDNCSQCGVCAKECPVGAIDIENSSSIDTQKCIRCCSCIKRCPVNARTMKTGTIKNIAIRLSQTCQDRKDPVFFL